MTDQLEQASSSPANLVALPRPVGGSAVARNGASERSMPERSPERPYVAFERTELAEILRIYGRMVAAGEWRDYAIDTLCDRAVFSIFRRTSEMPLYRIEKNPRLARRQGAYAVIAQSGMVLKRGGELARVLRVLDKVVLKLAD